MSQVEEVKNRLDITEVIRGYVRLQKAGSSWKGLCPFHSEKTPSFSVSPEKQMWYCFGCSEGGDVLTFIEKIEGFDFPDALQLLADRAGVTLTHEDPKKRSQRKKLLDILEQSVRFFETQLEKSRNGKKAQEYLRDRGVSDETIKEWRLGYAPDAWRGLYDYLSRSFSSSDIEAAGLTIQKKGKSDGWYDRFRHRIIFPIFDTHGKPIGIAGRTLDTVPAETSGEKAGKYINTPNTPLYDKSRALYGLHAAKDGIRSEDECIVVEGNLDVILSHQAGITHVIATSGTAFADAHLQVITRYTSRLALCFDSDEAGERATRAAAERALQKDCEVSVITLPEGSDAADLVAQDPERWEDAVSKRVPFVRFILSRALAAHDPKELSGKRAIVREVCSALVHVSPTERGHWIGELALAVNAREQEISQEFTSFLKDANAHSHSENVKEAAAPNTKKQKGVEGTGREMHLLALLVRTPEAVSELADAVEAIPTPAVRELIKRALAGESIEELLRSDPHYAPILARASFLDEQMTDEKAELRSVIVELRREALKKQLAQLEVDLKRAEKEKDADTHKSLLTQVHTLAKELASL